MRDLRCHATDTHSKGPRGNARALFFIAEELLGVSVYAGPDLQRIIDS